MEGDRTFLTLNSYLRGEPGIENLVFAQNFAEIRQVVNSLGGSLGAPPTAELPLTSALDYVNQIPDSGIDGLVQTPEASARAGDETGSISLQPNQSLPQVYLPLSVSSGEAFAVHGYLSQGGFGSSLTSVGSVRSASASYSDDEYSALLDSDPSAGENGQTFAYSLDTRLRTNMYVTGGGNHIKRLEIVRPQGNSVIFDFPWDPTVGQFRSYGTPLSGYTQRGDDKQQYVLREMPDGFTYRLEFASGIYHEFGSSVVVGDETGVRAQVLPPSEVSNQESLFQTQLLWTNGQLTGVKYQSTDDSATSITTTIAYAPGTWDVQSLTKSAVIGGVDQGTIAALGYTLNGSNTLTYGNGVTITRSAPYQPGGTVILTTTAPDMLGSYSQEYDYNAYGLPTRMVTTLNDGGSPPVTTTATTTYTYQNDGSRYTANGAAKWGKLTKITFPDGRWEAFAYAPDTGWMTEDINPFKSSQWNNNEASQTVTYYGYDASQSGNGAPADPGELVQLPRSTTTTVSGTQTSVTLTDVLPAFTFWNDRNVSFPIDIATTAFSTPVEFITRSEASSQQTSWAAAGQETRIYLDEYGDSVTVAPQGTVERDRNSITDNYLNIWLGHTVSQSLNQFDLFGAPQFLSTEAVGAAYRATNSTQVDPLGQTTLRTISGGLSSVTNYLSNGIYSWFGPASTTNPDGSTTTYTYTAEGFVKSATTAWGTSGRTLRHDYTYDAAGNVVSDKLTGTDEGAAHTASITTAYTYDALGRMTKEIDNSGGTDATANRITQWQYTFDSTNNQNVTTITLPGGATEIKRYYLDGTLASDTGTAVTPTTYDEGVIASDTPDANGNVETAGSTWTKVSTDGGANYTTTYTNMLGQQYLVQQSGPGTGATAGTTTANSYADRVTTFDANDRPYQVTDFDGSRSFVIYDPLTGRPAATIQDLNGDGSYEPNVDRKRIEHLSPIVIGGQTGSDDSQSLSDAGSSDFSESDTVSSAGEDYQQTDDGLTTDTRSAPPTGPGDWVTTITNPDQTTTIDTYTNGLLTQERTEGLDGTVLSTVTDTYDALGRLATSADWSGTTQYTYFQDGTPMSVQQPNHNPQTVNTIDPLTEQPTKITRPDGHNDFFGYNTLGQQTSQNGSGILPASFGYDLTNTGQFNNLTMYTSGTLNGAGAENTSWAFDANTGLPKSKTFADGSADTSLYNLAGDLAGVGLPGISAGSLGYNSAGEPTSQSLTDSLTGPVSSVVNQQDDMGRPVITSDTDNGKAFSTIDAYTPLGDLARETFGSAGNSFVNYDYFPTTSTPVDGSPDALQTMTVTPASGSSAATSYAYDPYTKKLSTISVNGTTFTINYLNGGSGNASTDWVSSVQAGNVAINFVPQSASGGLLQTINATGAGGASLYRGDYSYNAMDQRNDDEIARTNVSDAGVTSPETDSYGYIYSLSRSDALQEVDDNIAGTALDFYTYDGAGNQTGTSLGTPNTLNQYPALTYNARGDVTGDGTYTYGWDANDRLISVTPNTPGVGSYQVKFTYDSQDRWLAKDVYSYSSGTWNLAYSRHAVWDGSNLVAELDQNNALLKGYTWGPNGLLAVTDYAAPGGPKTYMVLSDASGNVVSLLDPVAGTVAASYHYDAWGNLTSSSGPAKNVCPFLGKGLYVHPELPWLMFAEHRVSNGRIWLSRDPSGESGGLNLYELFGNDPINYSDPTGNEPVTGTYRSRPMELGVGDEWVPVQPGASPPVLPPGAPPRFGELMPTWGSPKVGDVVGPFTDYQDIFDPTGRVIPAAKILAVRDSRTYSVRGPYWFKTDVGPERARQMYDNFQKPVWIGGTLEVDWATPDPGDYWDALHFYEATLSRFASTAKEQMISQAGFTPAGFMLSAVGSVLFNALKAAGQAVEAGEEGGNLVEGAATEDRARQMAAEEAVENGDLRVVTPNEAGLGGAGGRLGSPETRAQIQSIAADLERRGWTIVGGGGVRPEEFIPGPAGTVRGGAYPDITAIRDGRLLRINTYTTLADGVTPTAEEARRAANLRSLLKPGEHLLMIPKVQ